MSNLSYKFVSDSEKSRNFLLVFKEVNTTLAELHKKLARKIDIKTYEAVTTYVNEYVSYTSIWNLKFHYNFESPEVALLQCLHLQYILQHENQNGRFDKEQKIVEEMFTLFLQYSPYSIEQITNRKQKMEQFNL